MQDRGSISCSGKWICFAAYDISKSDHSCVHRWYSPSLADISSGHYLREDDLTTTILF